LFAPFTGLIVQVLKSNTATLFQSNAPAEYADGTVDYMTIMILHGGNYRDLASKKSSGVTICHWI
jgi:hypothetical protein